MNRLNDHSWALAAIFLIFHGCSPATDPQILEYRDSLLLSKEPGGSVTIEEARAQIDSTTDVVLTGHIGTRDLPQWWVDGASSFYVSEATPGSHYKADPNHDPTTCPFCKRKWKVEDSMALVHLVDDTGQQIAIVAPDILQVQQGDTVVIQGTAFLDESGFLVVKSDGVFMR